MAILLTILFLWGISYVSFKVIGFGLKIFFWLLVLSVMIALISIAATAIFYLAVVGGIIYLAYRLIKKTPTAGEPSEYEVYDPKDN